MGPLDEIERAIRTREFVRARADLWRLLPATHTAGDSAGLERMRAYAEELESSGYPCGELLAELERLRPDLFGRPERIQLARLAAAMRDGLYTVALDELRSMLPAAEQANDAATLDAIAVQARSIARIAPRADEREDGERLLEEVERIRPQSARAYASTCRCGRPFVPGEQFCPDCGTAAPGGTATTAATREANACSCGSPLARTDRFCPSCGKPSPTVTVPRVVAPTNRPIAPAQRSPYTRGPSVGGWAFAIFFLGFIGGAIGYFSLKNTDHVRADHIMKWGLIWSAVNIVLYPLIIFLFLLAVASSTPH